jgi:hypothetical protein
MITPSVLNDAFFNMTPFWAGLFENLRGRGRNAALFMLVMPSLVVASFVAARIPESVYRNTILPALPWVGLILVVWSVRVFLRARARSRERLARSTLSHDERCKARAKLVRKQSPFASKNSLVPPA